MCVCVCVCVCVCICVCLCVYLLPSLLSQGGPADQAGLQQLDTVLQLNGQPVEQWKCVEVAHAIRNSSNEIKVVVWRTGSAAKPSFEGLIHRPSYKPS
uniref:PDZ domain-containing protein n=1 Tax=Hucho hucho TaxID=62062 RepID=A0A4W5L014_9TELE